MKLFNIKESTREKIRFATAFIAYLLWVIWLGNYWFLFGLPIIFDIYITKKVNWSPWKKREGKNHFLIEWFDALIFAVVAVTIINIFLFQNYRIPTGSMEKSLLINDHLFVSKVAFGPRTPETPLGVPFTQNIMPLTNGQKESYSKAIQLKPKRLKGLRQIKRDDVVVFNFPEGDTVVVGRSNESYYGILVQQALNYARMDTTRSMDENIDRARNFIHKNNKIVVRPIDRRDNYIKRCVAIPGDTLSVIDGEVYIDGKPQKELKGKQFAYYVVTNGTPINKRKLEKLGIYEDDVQSSGYGTYVIKLTDEMKQELERIPIVEKIVPYIQTKGKHDPTVFPRHSNFAWNSDNMGPIYIPEAGATTEINLANLPLYKRIINYYEGNTLEVKDSNIYINGKIATEYTFKQDYYWMMGDNRHSSLDSRFWGYVPADHIVGSPKFVWLSLNKEKSFPANIRFKRFFKVIK
jgi:signal peptidase I